MSPDHVRVRVTVTVTYGDSTRREIDRKTRSSVVERVVDQYTIDRTKNWLSSEVEGLYEKAR